MGEKWKKIGLGVLAVVILFWLIELATPRFSLSAHLRQASFFLWRYPANYFSHLYFGLSQAKDLFRLSAIKKENLQLKEENLRLRQRSEELSQKLSALQKYEELLGSYPALRTVPVGVLGFFQEGGRAYIVIDKGSQDGLEEGKAVVWGKYLVGKIVELYRRSAVVETILSHRLVVNSYISSQPEAKGVTRGYLSNGLVLEGVPVEFQIKEGEVVLTSGLGGILPPHLIVGKVVKKVSSASEVSQRFLLEPLIDLHNLEIVFVVKN